MSLCRGRVLDIGAGAGRDALILKMMGLDVLPLDSDPKCVDIMHARGLPEAQCLNIYDLEASAFDSILIMQMTIGLVGTLDGLTNLFNVLTRVMRGDGQILLDSMSPAYLAGSPYYPGQRRLEIHYGRFVGETFPWLYVDFDVLKICAKQASLQAELIMNGPIQQDYLARVTKMKT
jgi:SAM-dependent methyltransferase